jgi:hypothetical protein
MNRSSSIAFVPFRTVSFSGFIIFYLVKDSDWKNFSTSIRFAAGSVDTPPEWFSFFFSLVLWDISWGHLAFCEDFFPMFIFVSMVEEGKEILCLLVVV